MDPNQEEPPTPEQRFIQMGDSLHRLRREVRGKCPGILIEKCLHLFRQLPEPIKLRVVELLALGLDKESLQVFANSLSGIQYARANETRLPPGQKVVLDFAKLPSGQFINEHLDGPGINLSLGQWNRDKRTIGATGVGRLQTLKRELEGLKNLNDTEFQHCLRSQQTPPHYRNLCIDSTVYPLGDVYSISIMDVPTINARGETENTAMDVVVSNFWYDIVYRFRIYHDPSQVQRNFASHPITGNTTAQVTTLPGREPPPKPSTAQGVREFLLRNYANCLWIGKQPTISNLRMLGISPGEVNVLNLHDYLPHLLDGPSEAK